MKLITEPMAILAQKIDQWTLARGNEPTTPYAPLAIYRHEAPTELISYVQEPSLCLIVQGKKRVLLNEETYHYDKDHYLITAIDLPLIAQIFEASEEQPYLGLTLKFEKKQIAKMLLDNHVSISKHHDSKRGLIVSKIELPIVQAMLRLMELLEDPTNIPVLAPLIHQEILYRLLIGEQGWHLQQISIHGSHSDKIARAIEWLKKNYDQSFKVEDLAAYSGMSPSSLHHHFRSITAMSPLQYQKRLRLHEARQLMLLHQEDVTTAAFTVGYESPSQFSREYSRLFGAPPSRDIKRLLNSSTN